MLRILNDLEYKYWTRVPKTQFSKWNKKFRYGKFRRYRGNIRIPHKGNFTFRVAQCSWKMFLETTLDWT
jgi:hypothetical protein